MTVNLISEVVRRQGGREAFKIDSSRVTRDSEVGRRDADIWGLMLALYRIFSGLPGASSRNWPAKTVMRLARLPLRLSCPGRCVYIRH